MPLLWVGMYLKVVMPGFEPRQPEVARLLPIGHVDSLRVGRYLGRV